MDTKVFCLFNQTPGRNRPMTNSAFCVFWCRKWKSLPLTPIEFELAIADGRPSNEIKYNKCKTGEAFAIKMNSCTSFHAHCTLTPTGKSWTALTTYNWRGDVGSREIEGINRADFYDNSLEHFIELILLKCGARVTQNEENEFISSKMRGDFDEMEKIWRKQMVSLRSCPRVKLGNFDENYRRSVAVDRLLFDDAAGV